MPPVLPFTDNPEANRLLGEDPLALLIGFALDQQVTVQHAFNGPWELRRRIGHLDPTRIATMDPAELERVFRDRPALHRYPASMAGRVAALCRVIADTYDGDASRIWREARDGADLEARLRALPSIGELKVNGLLAILSRRFGVQLPGLAERLPTWPTLGDVDTPEALERYQSQKRAHKAALRAAAAESGGVTKAAARRSP
ncbi:MAG TPA: HhH-GPD-type base excision DNA repair protein [Pleomorphomonadaceae bacterium]|nr:HhH-GPD-type base excision DNA repair protein [Pleomorphomonadaceae bacterium]